MVRQDRHLVVYWYVPITHYSLVVRTMQVKKEKKSFERSGSTRKQIRFDDDLVEKIDVDRKEQPFSEWVKDACWSKLNNKD